MQNQKIDKSVFLNFNQFKSILSLYLFSLGTSILGFSVYLFAESFGYSPNSINAWSGQSLFWGLILFFVSVFILFFPVEFLNNFRLNIRSFAELITNILFTITISFIFLISVQIFLANTSPILIELSDIFKATSFAGFIVIPLTLFALYNLSLRFNLLRTFGYNLVLFVWIFSILIFI